MAEGDISVKLTADASELTSALSDAAAASAESMDKISDSAKAAGDALDENLKGGAGEAKKSVSELNEETTNLSKSLEELKEKWNTVFEASGAAVAYEAFEKISESMKEAGEAAENLNSQAKILGITLEQFQALKEQSIELGVSQMALDRTFNRLNTTFEEANSNGVPGAINKLLQLGITTEMVTDKHKPLAEMIKIIHDRLADESTAEKEASALREQFGIRSAKLTELLETFGLTQEEVEKATRRVSSATDKQTESAEALGKEIKIMGATMDNWRLKSAAMTEELFHSRVAQWALLGPLSALILKYDQVGEAAETASGKIDRSGEATKKEEDAKKIASLQSMKIQLEADRETLATLRSGSEAKIEMAKKVIEEVEELYRSGGDKTSEAIKKSYAEAGKAVQEYTQRVFNEAKTTTDASVEATEKVTVARLESAKKILDVQLAQKQIEPSQYAEAEIYLTERVKDAEVSLYEAKKNALVNDGQNNAQNAAQRMSLSAQMATAIITSENQIAEIRHKEAEQINKDLIAEEALRMQGVKQAEDIAIQQAKAQQKTAANQGGQATDTGGVIAAAQRQIDAIAAVLVAQQAADADELAGTEKLYREKAIDADEYAKRVAAIQTREVQQVAAVSTQIESINDATAKKVGDQWKQAMAPIATGFTSMFDGMIKGTETFRTGMIKIADSILSEWEKSMITVPLEKWAQRMGQEVALKQASASSQQAIDQESSAMGLLQSAEQAIKQRAHAAATAAANTYSSVSMDGPFGWLLAPAEAAAAFAAVMAFPVASAKGGMMVEEDQMAMVHENEMILPSDIRKGIEQKILNNDHSQQNSSTNHFSINSMDAKSFEKYLSSAKNRNVVANAVNTARMRGNTNVRKP